MKKMKKAGFIIILVGSLLTIFSTFSFFTGEEMVKMRDLIKNTNKPLHFKWSPFIGIAMMGIGGVFVWKGYKK